MTSSAVSEGLSNIIVIAFLSFFVFFVAVAISAMNGSMVIVLVLPSWKQKTSNSTTADSV